MSPSLYRGKKLKLHYSIGAHRALKFIKLVSTVSSCWSSSELSELLAEIPETQSTHVLETTRNQVFQPPEICNTTTNSIFAFFHPQIRVAGLSY